MSVVVSNKLLVVLLGLCAAAVVGGFLLGRVMPCGLEQCATGPSSGMVDARLGDGDGALSLVVGGRSMKPVTPGASVPLDVTLTNPNDFAVRAGRVAVEIHAVRAPRSTRARACTADDFSISPASSTLEVDVAAQQTTALSAAGVPRADWPAVAMLDTATNQDGCKGATVKLRYAATGTQVLK